MLLYCFWSLAFFFLLILLLLWLSDIFCWYRGRIYSQLLFLAVWSRLSHCWHGICMNKQQAASTQLMEQWLNILFYYYSFYSSLLLFLLILFFNQPPHLISSHLTHQPNQPMIIFSILAFLTVINFSHLTAFPHPLDIAMACWPAYVSGNGIKIPSLYRLYQLQVSDLLTCSLRAALPCHDGKNKWNVSNKHAVDRLVGKMKSLRFYMLLQWR